MATPLEHEQFSHGEAALPLQDAPAASAPRVAGTTLSPARLQRSGRPTRWQEVMRSWIALIPLATAAAGSAVIQMYPTDMYAEMLPPLFFIGALIVTVAMVHQRHLYKQNLELTDELQVVHGRLDTLHHLSLELSTSLNVSEVAQTVLSHAMQFVNADEGALWLETEIASPEELRYRKDFAPGALPTTLCGASEDDDTKRWRLFAGSDLPADERQLHLDKWCRALERGVREIEIEGDFIAVPISWKGATGGVIFMRGLQQPFTDEAELLLQNVALLAGPSLQNALVYQSVSERAEIDGLTRLVNHRAIHERLTQELARVRRAREANPRIQFSLATMDITDFKLFNDTYGHAVGDEVLRRVSGCLRHIFRASDIVGRFGGDEFLVLLPDTPHAGAQALCERVVQLITAQPFVVADGSPITIRLTCGIATYDEDGVNAVELLQAADERLYEAKRKGTSIIEGQVIEAPVELPPVLHPDWHSVGFLETLITTIDAKDHYTRSHCERVWRYAILTAHQMGFSPDMMEAMHLCSLVHDVGKIVIPDAILRKPGRLSEDEFEIMQRHTTFGAMIVRELPHLPVILGGVRHHHEHWDGTGYPDALVADEIPVLGRVLAVADGFAAMTLQRPYRRALSFEQALLEVEEQKGKRYDPTVVEAFVKVMRTSAQDDAVLEQILVDNGIEQFAIAQIPVGV